MSEVSGYQRFFAELKRRKVFRVAAVYGAVAFVILQVADILVPALHLPESFTTGIALLAILGFPIAVVLAWAFDSTPAGIQRTDAAKTGEIEAIIAQPAASRWPSGLLALVGVVALAIGGWLALSSRSAADSEARSGTAVDVSSERTAVSGDAKSGAAPARTAVAVLPFQSLTNDEESREFALGIHDDLLTQLSRIEDLRVTSRTSVMTYVDSDKPVREIAAELGVGTVVEGGVRTAGEQVRINIQLIDAATDEHLWAETYDRELTAENVFAIQGEIARAVTGALEAELSEQEVAALAELPTSSTEAWAAYHRARRLWGTMGGDTNDRLIVAEYQQAVELDPEFVAAWAGLVRAQSWLIRRGLETDTMPARSSLDRLRELAPESPAGLIAEGYYRYYALADFEGALPVVQEYRRLRPGDAEGWQTEGWVLRRVGRWEESTESQRHAAELDPLNAVVLWNLAVNHRRMRRYGEAARLLEDAAGLAPENALLRLHWFQNEIFGRGNLESSRRIASLLANSSAPAAAAAAEYWVALFARDYDAAASAVRGGEPGEALRFPAAGDASLEKPRTLLLSLAARLEGNDEAARAWADSLIPEARAAVESRPVPEGGDRFAVAAIARSVLSVGLALRGEPSDTGEALELAEEAAALYGMGRDDVDGFSVEHLRLWTRVLVGENEQALDLIEWLLSRPSDLGPGELRLSPLYGSLRGDPRFEELVARAEALVQN
jgi:TolB-like protein